MLKGSMLQAQEWRGRQRSREGIQSPDKIKAADEADKVAVFDDPFNSQDAFRRRQTIHEILKIGRRCAQVIVLSHDATFLKQIWEKCEPAERASLALDDHGDDGSKI